MRRTSSILGGKFPDPSPWSVSVRIESGVDRDLYGIPRYDSSGSMGPLLARGLGSNLGVYHEMSRGCPAITGVLSMLRRTISRARYRIEVPVEDGDAQPNRDELELVDFCRWLTGLDGTGGQIKGGLARHLSQASYAFRYGFVPFISHEELLTWRGRAVKAPTKLVRVAPWSVRGWVWRDDDLVAIIQQDRLSRLHVIPIADTVLYTIDPVDGNPEGTSILRAAWVAWEAWKGTLVRYQEAEETQFGGLTLVRVVSDANGVPIRAASGEDWNTFVECAARVANGEGNLIEIPAGLDLVKTHPEYSIPSRRDMLEYYDRQIYACLSAVLLGLDASSAASAKLSGDLGRILLKSLKDSAGEIADVFSGLPGLPETGVLDRAMRATFGDLSGLRPPRLVPVGIDQESLGDWTDAITKLEQFRVVTPTPDVEIEARRRAQLKSLPRKELEAAREKFAGQSTQVSQ